MKRLLPLLLLGLAGSVHSQTIVLTHGPANYELRTQSGTRVSGGHATEAACWAAITAPGTYRCAQTGIITAAGVCTNNTPPPPVIVDGFKIRGDYAPADCPNDHVSFTQTQPRRSPFPSCAWAEQPVPVVNCDGLQIAPLLEDADTNTTQIEEPGPWVEDIDYPLGTPCPAAANGNCYAARWVVPPVVTP
jgi:hypothetical protein